jgi:hypothetical protein
MPQLAVALLAGCSLLSACTGASPTGASPTGASPTGASPTVAPSDGSPRVSASPPPEASSQAGRLGIDWTRVPSAPSFAGAAIDGVAARPDGLLAVGTLDGDNGSSLLAWVSSDGIEWRPTMPHPGAGDVSGLEVLAADAGWLIAGSRSTANHEGPTLWLSPDGLRWGELAVDGPLFLAQPVAAGGRVVALSVRVPTGGQPTIVWSSRDLRQWEMRSLPGAGFAYVRWLMRLDDGRLLATGRLSPQAVDVVPTPPGVQAFWTSPDGLSWELTPGGKAFQDATITALAGGGPGGYAAIGCRFDPADPSVPSQAVAWSSADGLTWNEGAWIGSLETCTVDRIVGVPGRWIVLAEVAPGGTSIVATSEDGRTWTVPEDRVRFGGSGISDVVRFGDALVAVGSLAEGDGGPAAAVVWISGGNE